MKESKKTGKGSGNFKKKHGENGERKQQVCKNTSKYFWSHGVCTHESVECIWKKPGHQDDATVGEKKGGSTE